MSSKELTAEGKKQKCFVCGFMPVRWMARKPNGQIYFCENGKTENGDCLDKWLKEHNLFDPEA